MPKLVSTCVMNNTMTINCSPNDMSVTREAPVNPELECVLTASVVNRQAITMTTRPRTNISQFWII